MTELAVRLPDTWSEATLDTLPDDGHRYEIVDGSLCPRWSHPASTESSKRSARA